MKTIDVNLMLGRPGTHASGVSSTRELIAAMDAHGVERGLVSHIAGAVHDPALGNDRLFDAIPSAASCDDRLVPLPVAGPEAMPAPALWQKWEAAGVRGVRACPAFYGYSSDEADALSSGLAERGWFLQMPLAPVYGGPCSGATVAQACAWAEKRNDLCVMIGGTHRDNLAELRAAMRSCANLWLDLGNQTTGTGVELLVADGFADRLVCGSGFGVSGITSFRDVVLCADIPEDVKTNILRTNALRLLGLS